MKKLICVILCICSMFGLAACAPEKPDYTALSEKAQTIADTLVSDYGSTSVQYAIIDGGEIILSGSSGVYDKSSNRALTKDDMYAIGSTSKMYAAAAAMTLVDKGLLDIDAPLTDYIPEFKMADERYKEITPRMLLNHSSGMSGSSFLNAVLFDDVNTFYHDTLLERLALQRLKSAPGEICEYCNDGFSLLEILVERISAMSYTEYLNENFFKPLNIVNTKTPQDDFDKTQMVKAYTPLFECALPVDVLNALGTGGIYSTAEDLCRFADVLMGNKPEILSEHSTVLMRNEEYKSGLWPEDNGESLTGYGLGWDTVNAFPFGDYGIKAAVKGGDSQVFHSSLVTIPEYDIAMASISSGGSSVTDYAFNASILQELLLQKGIIEEISPLRTWEAPVAAEMPEEYTEFSGIYAKVNEQKLVTVKDGVLKVADASGEDEYIYGGNEQFFSGDGSDTVKFLKLEDGNTYIQTTSFPVFPGLGQIAACSLYYQKMEPVSITPELLDAWKTRAGKRYYILNECSTSQSYFVDVNGMSTKSNDDFESGYAFPGAKITDENSALNTLKYRDAVDYFFHTENGTEYLKAGDFVYIREDAIPELTADIASCGIGEDGYNKYFNIGADAAGKTMTVALPEGASYAVYDENTTCVEYSTITQNTTTTLPANGKVVFIGSAGDVFGIELQ